MAHSRALARFAPRHTTVVIAPRRRGRIRRAAGAVGGAVRRGARRAAPALPLFGTLAAAGGLGYLEASKKLNFVPTVLGSRAATFGIAGFAITRFFKHPTIRMIGAAAAVAGAFDIGRVKGGGVSGFEDDGGAGPGGGM